MHPDTVLTLLGMAGILVVMRVGGYWLAGHLSPSPRITDLLEQVAGVTLVALTAPAVLGAGTPGLLAAVAAGIVGRRTGSVVGAMLMGMAVVGVARLISADPP